MFGTVECLFASVIEFIWPHSRAVVYWPTVIPARVPDTCVSYVSRAFRENLPLKIVTVPCVGMAWRFFCVNITAGKLLRYRKDGALFRT